MRFTREEFNTMVKELLYDTPISFDMLCKIAEKTLRPTVINWCRNDSALCGRGCEDDIMQEIHLRLIKTTIDYFLLRRDIDTPYNDNPEGFEDWMFKVADNIKRDFANKTRRHNFNTEDLENPMINEIPETDDSDELENINEKLSNAFSIVVSSDVGVYKILTWVAQFIYVLDEDVTKIKSNELILARFENKTLNEMYEIVLEASKKIPWIKITKEQDEKILSALRKTREDNVTYGESKYQSFFMKQNGKVSGKKSISDWVNRMNDMIKRKAESTDPANKANKKNSDIKGQNNGSSANEASDC